MPPITLTATLVQLSPVKTTRTDQVEKADPADKAKKIVEPVLAATTFVKADLRVEGPVYGGQLKLDFADQPEALALLSSGLRFKVTLEPLPA